MADDKRDPPIEPLAYLAGVKVVDIGDLRVARGMSRRPVSTCRHLQLRYDAHERRIWCADCETNIESFDAFVQLTENFSRANNDIERRMEKVVEAEAHALISRAAKAVDKAWRSTTTAPMCPHCRGALLPEDFSTGLFGSVSLELERRRRQTKSGDHNAT